MEPNETVLSDIHINMSHSRPVDCAENLDTPDKYAGLVQWLLHFAFVSLFTFPG